MVTLEIFATVAGVAYLYYAVRQRALCWAFYIISALAYFPVFLESGLYLYAVFQLLFMLAGVVGLFLWCRNQKVQQGIVLWCCCKGGKRMCFFHLLLLPVSLYHSLWP